MGVRMGFNGAQAMWDWGTPERCVGVRARWAGQGPRAEAAHQGFLLGSCMRLCICCDVPVEWQRSGPVCPLQAPSTTARWCPTALPTATSRAGTRWAACWRASPGACRCSPRRGEVQASCASGCKWERGLEEGFGVTCWGCGSYRHHHRCHHGRLLIPTQPCGRHTAPTPHCTPIPPPPPNSISIPPPPNSASHSPHPCSNHEMELQLDGSMFKAWLSRFGWNSPYRWGQEGARGGARHHLMGPNKGMARTVVSGRGSGSCAYGPRCVCAPPKHYVPLPMPYGLSAAPTTPPPAARARARPSTTAPTWAPCIWCPSVPTLISCRVCAEDLLTGCADVACFCMACVCEPRVFGHALRVGDTAKA